MLAFCGFTWWRKLEKSKESTDFGRVTTILTHVYVPGPGSGDYRVFYHCVINPVCKFVFRQGNREADQRLRFRYTDSTIPLLPKSDISCCGCSAWFMSDLVENPEDRFSHNEAQLSM